MLSLHEKGYWFGVIGARTVPDGLMGSAYTANGLAVGRDYPEDMRMYRQATEGKVLIAGPNTAKFVLPQQGTLGRDIVIAGRHAPAGLPFTCHSLEDAIAAVDQGTFGDGREAMVVGGPNMLRGACELVRSTNFGADSGKRALLLMTEFHDTATPRHYQNDGVSPTFADLPENVYELSRERQPNETKERPDFDFVQYTIE